MNSTPPADGYGQPDYGQQPGGYPSYSTAGPGGGIDGGAPPARPAEMPASVAMAVKLLWTSIGLSLVNALVAFTMLDTLVNKAYDDATANATVAISREVVRTGVIAGMFFFLAIGLGLTFLLLIFIRKGANWARIVYTVIGVLGFLSGLMGLGDQAPVLLVARLIGFALTAATLFFLWKKESAAWFTRARAN